MIDLRPSLTAGMSDALQSKDRQILLAEVKRLAEAVSSGFTRGFNAKGKEQPMRQRFKDGRAERWHEIESRFPHFVDLVPPEDGFSETVEDQIERFLEPLCGLHVLIVDLRHDDLIERYCFAREKDAAAFRAAFAGAAMQSDFKNVG